MNANPPDRSDLLGWGTVRASLALTFFGCLLFFMSFLLLGVLLATQEQEIRKVPVLMVVAGVLSSLGVLAGLILIFTGVCMTMAAPRSSGARLWGVLATVCAIVFVVLVIVLVLAGLDA